MRKGVIVPLLAAVVCACWTAQAGSLDPPGPPAPTMKTLDQVEPRLPILSSDLPLIITTPGSYYLAEDVTTTGSGIQIQADNVTIDLMGFSLSGGTGDGITSSGDRQNLVVRNGTVSGWAGHGINLISAASSLVINVLAETNGIRGIAAGLQSSVIDTTVRSNAGTGITTDNGSIITGCAAISNSGAGFSIGSGSTVSQSVARNNGSDGFQATVSTGCVFSHCTATENDGAGFTMGSGSRASDCAASANKGDGIRATDDTLIIANICHDNGDNDGSAGVRIMGERNRIEANHVTNHADDIGIKVESSANLIVKNSSINNGTNYDIVSGNTVGPVVPPADPITSTNPWANFED